MGVIRVARVIWSGLEGCLGIGYNPAELTALGVNSRAPDAAAAHTSYSPMRRVCEELRRPMPHLQTRVRYAKVDHRNLVLPAFNPAANLPIDARHGQPSETRTGFFGQLTAS